MGTKGAGRVRGATGYEQTLRRWCVDGLLRRKIMSSTLPQRRAVTGALVLALCLLMLSGAASRAQAACGLGSFVPSQVIVKLNPIPGATVEHINATYGSTTLETFPGSTDIYLLELPASSGVTETVERMASDPRLLYAEPNFFAQPPEGGGRHRAWGASDVAPTSDEYAAQALGLEPAHSITQGEGTTVAVVDTGAQLDHPALAANFKRVNRYDFVGNDTDPSDRPVGKDADCDGDKDEMVGHGTHVAGIVDITAPEAKIIPVSKYAYWSGTSMATPFVSGQAALIHAVYGSLDPAGVEEKIRSSARSLLATDPLYAAMLGAGRADVCNSLSAPDCSS